MPLLNSLATPYAEALLQVTEARDESQTVSEQCKQLLGVWDSSAEFRDAMVSPVLEPSSKKKALESLLADECWKKSHVNSLSESVNPSRFQQLALVLAQIVMDRCLFFMISSASQWISLQGFCDVTSTSPRTSTVPSLPIVTMFAPVISRMIRKVTLHEIVL